MGGNACCEGNVAHAAEYNTRVDPEAARIVLRSGLPIELVGWHLSRGEAVLSTGDIDKILRLDPLYLIGSGTTALSSQLANVSIHSGGACSDTAAASVGIASARNRQFRGQ
jgi:inosine-uridine nucleoside N-ribohydrolase